MHMESNITTTYTSETTTKKAPPAAALTALAVVAFITLIFLGIALAIYSAQFVPALITKITAGLPKDDDHTSGGLVPQLVVVSATSTTYTQNVNTIPTNPVNPNAQLRNIGEATTRQSSTTAYTAPHTTTAATVRAPHGLPDLTVTMIATGYLTNDSTDSFVPARIIPPGARPAAKFSIANQGTNVTGPWNFLAMIPTTGGTIFHSPSEPSMGPGDHTVFTLGFSQAIPGPAQTITIVADPYDTINESNKGNNSASAAVTITATGN
jgi:hypothetical protein